MKNTMRRFCKTKKINPVYGGIAFNVLKDSASDGDSKVLQEAEKVVEKYMGKKAEKKRGERRKKNVLWWVSIISFGLGLLATKLFI